jgi:very-short-patch-repair endonuclease
VAEKFRELDRLVIEHNRARLAHAHWRGVPTHEAGGQLGVVKREIQKKRRHLPIRQLVRKAGDAIQAIKPVFMMSPLSIANFLEPGALDFDLVVFDEASQVRPVEALGAIARGKQVVVVGDGKQLPPTSFFDRLAGAEEADEESLTADLESVLGLFSAQGAPERMLRWHYRSRHESLITVSNHEFYEDRLVVFPSPDQGREEAGLLYHYLPDTVYDRGGTRSNVEEAKAVAQAVMDHARTRPGRTLGVAAFSTAQAQAVEDQLEILRRADPSCEGFFSSHPHEPFFVKNLENVQGDERDVVFISVGYGRIAGGYVPMSFGPLNQDGGERRLNVLITRARMACEVFTNLTADDIDLGRSSARGVRALKTFLKYAKDGELDVPVATGREPDSPFEESVLSALRAAGYQVEPQVGSAGFFIDLAVVDPERPGRYLLGVECDGATYHSARSARDRDRLRQEVLEGLGWRIHRVWSTDWFSNPEGELRRLVGSIEEARLYGRPPGENGHGTRVATGDIERDEEPGPTQAPAIPLYEMANFRLDVEWEFHQTSPDSLAEVVAEIVEVEGPVHTQEVSRRVTEAASITRTGSRIRALLEDSIDSAVRKRKVSRSGDFLWYPGMQEAPLRDRSELPAASRKLELVAPEEIEAAIGKVIADSYGAGREEIPPAVLSLLLGFKRTTEAAQRRVTEVLDGMIADGRVVEEGNHVSLKR